ncbi:nucleoside triphosphate pyrophosphohydrolase [Weissella confusa]|uniref:nucleoside triphosphate pyrophosphohydrolase n=1 Tax=Weissella confusa TaxID=1583 RepID=UPI00223BBF15|nr:nucleoside triphosphate pyrophosphohydrolase [Weissella confusa]MCT0023764.1 phosphoribosyl-ATP pyrophosphohydrolase [Weissella confusa]
MSKLVRDNIPNFVPTGKFKQLSGKEIKIAIKVKLAEEVREIQEASTKEHLIEELADLYELLKTYVNQQDVTWDEFEESVKKKKKERGGFSKSLYMVTDE